MELTAEELRVLGALIEKEATTPDQYPLSTNALTNACNQKTSRDPVVSYDQRTVSETMLLLRPAGLARTIISGRTEKHRHVLDEALGLDRGELAVLAVLMLRGAQTPGELRTRTERAHGFASADDVEAVLQGLAARDVPIVRNLGRGPGQSQDRWQHLLGATDSDTSPAVVGRANLTEPASSHSAHTASAPVPASVSSSSPHRPSTPEAAAAPDASEVVSASLERRVAELEQRIAALEAEFGL